MDGIKPSKYFFFFFFLNATRHNAAAVSVAFIWAGSLAWEYSEQNLCQGYLARENCNLRDLSKAHKWHLWLCAAILVEGCAGEDKEKEWLGRRVPCPALLPLECWSQAKAFGRNSAPFRGSDEQCILIQKPDFRLSVKNQPTPPPPNHTAETHSGCGACAKHMYAIANAKGLHKGIKKLKIRKIQKYLGVFIVLCMYGVDIR